MLREALRTGAVHYVALTGDITHSGRAAEGRHFMHLFADLLPHTITIPGNHDRCGDDFASVICSDRGWCVDRPGVRFICLDSTQPGNEMMPLAWGGIEPDQIAYAIECVRRTARDVAPVVLLHHHVLPQASESPLEAFSDSQGWPMMRPAEGARQLLWRMPSRTLILHGHKHQPTALERAWHPRVYNAGSTTELGQFRVFELERGEATAWSWALWVHAPEGVEPAL